MRAESCGAPLAGVPGVDVGEGALDRERRPHGPLGVVLLRLRIAEESHQPVAELLQHMAAERRHRRGGFVEIGVDEAAPILSVEPRRERCRTDEIAEHDRDRPALGARLGQLVRGANFDEESAMFAELATSMQRSRLATVTDRQENTHILEAVVRQPREQIRVDLILETSLRIGRGRDREATRRRPWPRPHCLTE